MGNRRTVKRVMQMGPPEPPAGVEGTWRSRAAEQETRDHGQCLVC